MTYLVAGWAGTALDDRKVHCAPAELANFDPPPGQTCRQYLSRYFAAGAPGQLYNPSATRQCQYCPLTSASQFLARSDIYPSERWRNFGIGWSYVVFNIAATVGLYYVFRVRRLSLVSLAKGPARNVDAVLFKGEFDFHTA